mgnify:FL=1
MKVIIINGPNLNLLGLREKSIYGEINFKEYFSFLKNKFPNIKLSYFQSNIEGEIVDKIHEVGFSFDYIILNAAAYTHTSIAIADALDPITTPVIEVHISNIYSREEFRRKSLISKNCKSVICGFGLDSYELALYSIDH